MTGGLTYQQSGVDTQAAARAVRAVSRYLEATRDNFTGLPKGFFTGGMGLPPWVLEMDAPILVMNSDGVGSITKEAVITYVAMERMGYALANHVFMDLVCSGARPLAFVDTMDWHTIHEQSQTAALRGMARSAQEVGAAVLGGETGQVGHLMKEGQCLMNAAAVGFVDEKHCINGQTMIRRGDAIVGIGAIGAHINGWSLGRRVIFEDAGLTLEALFPGTKHTVFEEMTKGVPNYAKQVLALLADQTLRPHVHGIFNVTGDGIPGNLARILPHNMQAMICADQLPKLPIFELLKQYVAQKEMWRTFNLGIGVGLVVAHYAHLPVMEALLKVNRNLGPIFIGSIRELPQDEEQVITIN